MAAFAERRNARPRYQSWDAVSSNAVETFFEANQLYDVVCSVPRAIERTYTLHTHTLGGTICTDTSIIIEPVQGCIEEFARNHNSRTIPKPFRWKLVEMFRIHCLCYYLIYRLPGRCRNYLRNPALEAFAPLQLLCVTIK
uniref:Uncharacterized protein n=1 Tax=Anopheles culicifacies TaxID=139723 RepID=A0A182MNW5_9DIPT